MRFFATANGTIISINAHYDWIFPSGTVILKNFALGGKLIGTRLLMPHPDGAWAGYTCESDDAQTDASRLRGGKARDVNGQLWVYPSAAQCMEVTPRRPALTWVPRRRRLTKIAPIPRPAVRPISLRPSTTSACLHFRYVKQEKRVEPSLSWAIETYCTTLLTMMVIFNIGSTALS